jgi:hypothetical protein
MAPFVVTCDSPLSPEAAWKRVTDWPRHGEHVPLTAVSITTPPPTGVGTVFNGRTSIGRFGFDDPMEIVEWQPPSDGGPGHCRIEKRGTVMLGWAELTVEPLGTGSRSTWREQATAAKAPKFADGVSALSGRVLFGRVLRKLLAD